MGAIIGYRSRVIYCSNGEWENAMDDALRVAEGLEITPQEKDYISRFRDEMKCLYSGYCPSFEILFPTDEEKIFWAKAWISAAQQIVSGALPAREHGDPARRVFINYWCGSIIGFLLKGEEIDSRQIAPRTLNSQDAAQADGELLLYELEWERRYEEISRRGIMPVGIENGKGTCPFCGEAFEVTNPYQWNGRRHLPCLTWLSPQSSESAKDAEVIYPKRTRHHF